MKKVIAKLKPWYYLFAFFIALPYAMANDGDRIYHWRYLVAYALLGLFFISYKVRNKMEAQKFAKKRAMSGAQKTEELGKKAFSLALQLVFAWMLSSVYVSALSVVAGESLGVGAVITILILLLIVGLQRSASLQVYSRAYVDARRVVYWLATSVAVMITMAFSSSGLYGSSRYSTAEIFIALGAVLPIQIGCYFAMKVSKTDPSIPNNKKV
jgi:hypothetical protein